MSEMEISIYDSWFNPVVSELPGLVPDAFIYLRASPDTCMQRLHSRKRQALYKSMCMQFSSCQIPGSQVSSVIGAIISGIFVLMNE